MQQTQTKENKMGVMPIPKLLITMSLPMMLSMLVQALYNIVDSIFVAQIDEYAMGVMPIPKLLITMSLPMMLSMLVQALYNIVDSIFVAQIDEYALTAVSLAFPLQNLMIGVATGTGVGINALLSRSLGEKNEKEASLAANNGIFLALVSYLVFALIGLTVSRPFFAMQTNIPEIVEYGTTYLTIICICSFGLFMQIAFERLLQSTGKTLYTMITQSLGAIINIIMDPILIFGLFGFPKMGVAGAAVATVFGQIIAMTLALIFNLKVNHEIRLGIKGFHPNMRVIRVIYSVGVPSIIMMAIGSVMTFGFNKILLMFTSTATAVFGVYFKLNSFAFMPVFGLNNGMIPIIAYNYGAQNKQRITATIKMSICIAVSLMLIGLAVFQLIPDKLPNYRLQLWRAKQAAHHCHDQNEYLHRSLSDADRSGCVPADSG